MTWNIDDQFGQHRKVLAIPRRQRIAATGLWLQAGLWVSGPNGTDGWVPPSLPEDIGAPKSLVQALVEAGLWHAPGGTCDHDPARCPGVPETGWTFHDWLDWNRSRRRKDADRKAARERMQRHRSNASGSPPVRANTPRTNAAQPANFAARSSPVQEAFVQVHVPGSPEGGTGGQDQLQSVCRLTGADARDDGRPTDDVIAHWQDIAGPAADLAVEAAAWLRVNAGQTLRDPLKAWEAWLRKARPSLAVVPSPPQPSTDPEPMCPDHPYEPLRYCRSCIADRKAKPA